MTLLAGLGYVLVAIALFQSSLCAEQGDEVAVAGPVNCTIEFPEGELLSPNASMYFNIQECFLKIGYEHPGPSPSDELIRSLIATRCNKSAILSKCLDDLDSQAIECLDAVELRRHRLYRQYNELNFRVMCEDNETDVVDVWRFRDEENIADNFVVTCDQQAEAQLGPMEDEGVNRFMLYEYRLTRKTVECLEAHKGGARNNMANWAITGMNKISEAMRCVDQEGAEVLCKTIA